MNKLTNGDDLNGVTIGLYIYLSEENNPYDSSIEYVHTRITYNYDKTKVRYRVVGINKDGSIKVERADVLRDLPDTISIEMEYPYHTIIMIMGRLLVVVYIRWHLMLPDVIIITVLSLKKEVANLIMMKVKI